jgi:hypothetical protein
MDGESFGKNVAAPQKTFKLSFLHKFPHLYLSHNKGLINFAIGDVSKRKTHRSDKTGISIGIAL